MCENKKDERKTWKIYIKIDHITKREALEIADELNNKYPGNPYGIENLDIMKRMEE